MDFSSVVQLSDARPSSAPLEPVANSRSRAILAGSPDAYRFLRGRCLDLPPLLPRPPLTQGKLPHGRH